MKAIVFLLFGLASWAAYDAAKLMGVPVEPWMMIITVPVGLFLTLIILQAVLVEIGVKVVRE